MRHRRRVMHVKPSAPRHRDILDPLALLDAASAREGDEALRLAAYAEPYEFLPKVAASA